MSYETVLYERRGPAAIITLNRPEALNAISPQLLVDLHAALAEARGDEAVRAVILTGAGERAWSAGVDIKAMGDEGEGSIADREGAASAWDVIDAIEGLPVPVIAAINGYCITGALELATACDLVIASDRARFSDTHARWGLTPTWGGSQRLPRTIGKQRAFEMVFICDMVAAQDALRIGLCNKVVPAEALLDEALVWAEKIAENSRGSIAEQKRMVVQGLRLSLGDAYAYADWTSPGRLPDAEERLEAFRQGSWDKTRARG